MSLPSLFSRGLFLLLFIAVSPVITAQQVHKFSHDSDLSLTASKQAGSQAAYYDFNSALFSDTDSMPDTGDLLLVAVNGSEETFRISRITSYMPGTVSVISRNTETGRPFSFTVSGSSVAGLYHKATGENVHFLYDKRQKSNYYTNAGPEDELFCSLHDEAPLSETEAFQLYRHAARNKSAGYSAGHTPNSHVMAEAVDDSITIDLMLVYTDAAETWAQQDFNVMNLDQVIAQAMNLSQTALDNSGVHIELRLVYTHKTDYDEENDGENVSSGDRLRRLTSGPNSTIDWGDHSGYMEEVHPLRDEYGADIVAMLARVSDTGGVGWINTHTRGREELGFNLNRVQQVASGYTLIHEIGHNMGNAHSRTQQQNPADDTGGLFQYSAGYRNEPNDFATVMAYAEGLEDIPLFSSPFLFWEDKAAGSGSTRQPTDNARSMREIKRAIAAYRPTMVDAPVASVSTDRIEVEMNREDALEISFDISNSGGSALVWDADFDFPGSTVAKAKSGNAGMVTESPALRPEVQNMNSGRSLNLAPKKRSANMQDVTVYETSFEGGEGFSMGSFDAISGWRALSSNGVVNISTDNPKTGSRHLRIEHQTSSTSTQFLESPFFGDQPLGNYEMSFDFAVSETEGSESERFDIYIFDSDTRDLSAGLFITGGGIDVWCENEALNGTSCGTTANINSGQYYSMKIRYSTDDETISYYLNDQLISESEYVAENRSPDYIYLVHGNEQAGSYLDIDNLKIVSGNTPYTWLKASDFSGVVFEDATGAMTLSFNTEGVEAGTYETDLRVYTNDPENPVFEIPVTLTVGEAVSTEEPSSVPGSITLDQNYPNPFNPETTIAFELPEAARVKLEVYSITGKKVAGLINSRYNAGSHEFRFNASELASGVYIYRLQTESAVLSRQMVLIK